MAHFPSRVEDLTPELLSDVMSEQTPGVVVSKVDVIQTSQCGDGFASTADRVVLGIEYAPGSVAGPPTRLMLKTMLAHPHAPGSMYQNEVRFYTLIRPELTIEAPRAFGSMFDPDSNQFGILMEDLSTRPARFPNVLSGTTVDEVRGVIQSLAGLHAHFWQSPRFATDLAWLPTPTSGGMYKIFTGIGLDLIKDQVARNPFKADLIAPLGKSLDELWDYLWRMQRVLSEAPSTLLHGDPHIANTYLLQGGVGGLLDWQLMAKGRWAHDLTYLMVTGLSTEDRRTFERELIAEYLDTLATRGVANPPGEEEAWLLYRQSVIWGLVIGWLITPPENYGESITVGNLERLVAAVQDLETLDVIP